MKFDIFPEENSLLIEGEARSNIDRLTTESKAQQQKLHVLMNTENNRSGSNAIIGGMLTGGAVGLFVCFGVCTFDVLFLDMDAPILEIVSLVICIVLGVVFRAMGSNTHQSKAMTFERQLQEEVARLEKDIKTIQDDAQLRANNYLEAFESAVRDASAYFINNPIADEIVEFLWGYFKKQIDGANRSSSIENIAVHFVFTTTADSVYIGSDLGRVMYDFEQHRVEILNLERTTALAKALETALQLRGMTEYAADISGTVPTITIHSERKKILENERVVESTVTYSAANGNYQQARSW